MGRNMGAQVNMSYIRCLSNPELLYIWQGSDRKVYITHGVKYPLARLGVKNYRDNPAQFTVPFHIFRDAIKKWDKYGFGKVTYRGFTIEEIEIYSDTLKEVKKKNRPFSEMIK